jgi:hypothetical protein
MILQTGYSDGHCDIIVGSSGSAPLHFAAANRRTDVVRTFCALRTSRGDPRDARIREWEGGDGGDVERVAGE